MASPLEMLERISQIDIEAEFAESLERNKSVAIEMNKDQLYYDGVKSDGTATGQYAASTKKIKSRKGQRTDHVTGKDTGGMYDALFLSIQEPGGFVMDSADNRSTPGFVSRYGSKVFGLTDDNKAILGKETLGPDVVHSISNKTGVDYGL